MRKLLLTLAVLGVSTAAMAQDTTVPTKKYSVATNSFWANWYVSAGVDVHAAYTSEEAHGMSFNPFSGKRGDLGFTVAVGKWFTPGIGLRTKFNGIWSKKVISDNDHHSYKYWNIHEDVTFNLSNMLFGYNEKRVWNFIPYVGIGVVRNMSAGNTNYDISYNVGLLNNFRVSKHVQIFLDIYGTAFEGSVDHAATDGWSGYDKFHARHWDKLFGANVGITYNLGKCTWEKTPDVDALMAMNKEQMDALQNSLKEQQDENARLRDLLANQKPAQTVTNTVKEYASTAQSVFFNIGSSKIASRKDLVNVKEVAEYAKENNRKIVVTGYADSKTGSAEYNQKLSEQRAQTVADELVKMGVNRDNIVVEGKGGVDTISPFAYNRRATVKVQ